MENCCQKSTITRKAVMAVTGLLLFLFVVAHMLGNLQIFMGREALNSYAEHLEDLPLLLWPARVFLLGLLVIHVFTSISLAIENKRARPVPYARQSTVQASYASRTMVISGLLIFIFIVYHLLHFTFKAVHPQYSGLTDEKGRHDVYSMVVLSFRDPWVAGSYAAAMVVLCAHLSHGIQSLFQSLGLSSDRTRRTFKKLAIGFALLIFAGNTSIVFASVTGLLKLPPGVR